jgi:hypothetical protein
LTAPRAVLPDAIRALPLVDKLQRLANLDPEKLRAFETLVDETLEQCWRENFFAGKRGGVMLKSAKAGLESDQRRAKAIAAKGGPL